jgi:hypothetical protein
VVAGDSVTWETAAAPGEQAAVAEPVSAFAALFAVEPDVVAVFVVVAVVVAAAAVVVFVLTAVVVEPVSAAVVLEPVDSATAAAEVDRLDVSVEAGLVLPAGWDGSGTELVPGAEASSVCGSAG